MSKRAALVALGAALIVSGGVLVAGGGALVAVVGPDRHPLVRRHHPHVHHERPRDEPGGDIDARGAEILTDPSLELKVRSWDKPVFVGAGPADEVDRYLAGASIEKVTDFELNPFGMTTDVRDGAIASRLTARRDVLGRTVHRLGVRGDHVGRPGRPLPGSSVGERGRLTGHSGRGGLRAARPPSRRHRCGTSRRRSRPGACRRRTRRGRPSHQTARRVPVETTSQYVAVRL